MEPYSSEVLARIQPIPSTSGISLREYPLPSYSSLKQTCLHYEMKNTGIVCHKCKASRNLFDLSKEIQEQLEPLIAEEKRKDERIALLEASIVEWEKYFVLPPSSNSRSPALHPFLQKLRAETSPILTPKIIFDELLRLGEQNEQLERVVNAQADFSEAQKSQLEFERLKIQQMPLVDYSRQLQEIKNQVDEAIKSEKERTASEITELQLAHEKEKESLIQDYNETIEQLRKELVESQRQLSEFVSTPDGQNSLRASKLSQLAAEINFSPAGESSETIQQLQREFQLGQSSIREYLGRISTSMI
ncbi:hypothetical protein BLNAU_20325 [Blattamonas nauphoetae]|uniref:Uncharacterized protein n=1 Tax=Blattamonas nauphoetae TaxID=2049346 RepID=A0ABQ9X370_9EUKA|nr:hypothetical protein BLNAU_20325 [Blattamonas nauphoetae]